MASSTKGYTILGQPIRYIPILILALWGLYLFAYRGIRFFEVPSRSMEPTLLVGDRLVTMREEQYARGDIIVIWDEDNAEYLVKRITGLPGDVLMVGGGALMINTHYASEPYIKEPMIYTFPHPVTVEPESVFVMGDNRNMSEDSSTNLRPMPMKDIAGKVCYVYYPFNRSGAKPSYPLANIEENSLRGRLHHASGKM